jgi:hypothetical protein
MVVNLPGPADWIGRVLPVRLTGSGAYSLRGDALTPETRAEEAPAHAH